jgi:hypothetical protein
MIRRQELGIAIGGCFLIADESIETRAWAVKEVSKIQKPPCVYIGSAITSNGNTLINPSLFSFTEKWQRFTQRSAQLSEELTIPTRGQSPITARL